MLNESNLLNKILATGKKLIPKPVFAFLGPIYHWGLAITGAMIYGFPSKKLKIIGVTGTKGKSTTVFMISKIFEEAGLPVAAIGSLGYKIKDKEWPNNLKMTMPGRFKLQKFLSQAKRADARYVVLEVTSEGIAQHRLTGVNIDCAVFTNLHKEHIESHGSFEKYLKAKQQLFYKTRNIHVLNIDDPYFEKFANYPAKTKITFGKRWGLVNNDKFGNLKLKIMGDFNEANALGALAVAEAYRFDMNRAVATLNSIETIPGRMEIINTKKKFQIVIDYAHTPDSLEMVYKYLKGVLMSKNGNNNNFPRLICVLGAAGGGRDKWKRPEFGRIAWKYCNEIILTNEDPYDEDPEKIIDQISSGFPKTVSTDLKFQKILDRKEAIETALSKAHEGDIVVITGKGSEISMALSNGEKIPWSDKQIVLELIN